MMKRAIRIVKSEGKKWREVLSVCFRSVFQKPDLYLLNTPNHGNLGDQAILLAERLFLQEAFPGIKVLEIPGELWGRRRKLLLKRAIGDKPIALHGGGYLGDLWPMENERAKEMLNCFPGNPGFCFPQSCSYQETDESALSAIEKTEGYQRDKKAIGDRGNFLWMAREERSFQILKSMIASKDSGCELIPDIVLLECQQIRKLLSEEKERGHLPSGEVLFCLRKDHERQENPLIEQLLRKVEAEKIPFRITDTVEEIASHTFEPEYWQGRVKKKLIEFSDARLVITDRLHGLLFAVVTGTPCMAFDNVNHKVNGCYEWLLRDLPSVTMPQTEGEAAAFLKMVAGEKETEGEKQWEKELLLRMEPYKKSAIEGIRRKMKTH